MSKEEKKVPEGYTLLDYLVIGSSEIKNSKFILPEFQTADEVAKRINELRSKYLYDYKVLERCASVEYAIVIPQQALSLLSSEERDRLIPYQEPVLLETYSPIVYRFMEEEFIDRFFSDGEFLLTTYSRCRKLEDVNRQDAKEGEYTYIGKNDTRSIEIHGGPTNVLMCCTSLSQNNTSPNGKTYGACLKINDVEGFHQALTDQLIQQGFQVIGSIKGPCTYSEKVFQAEIDKKIIDAFMGPPVPLDFSIISMTMSNIGRDHVFFAKPLNFQHECEYRFVWLINRQEGLDKQIIHVPQARQFCEKIVFEDSK